MSANSLQNAELFIFTDNMTMEGTFYRGNSDSKLLFELILWLQGLDLHSNNKIHIVHVAGSCMVHQGTNGLSRGDLSSGVMIGAPILDYIPLHLTALDHSSSLLPWIQQWCPASTYAPCSQWSCMNVGMELKEVHITLMVYGGQTK
jgi:hypothetical protein